VRVVADSHAIIWYLQGSDRIAAVARSAIRDAERSDGVVVSVASLVDLWYVTQTTKGVAAIDLARLREHLQRTTKITWEPISVQVAEESMSISRDVLPDPWDRFIVATARVLDVALVTKDEAIRAAQLVETVW
jgi:PIN domain nuclease of toxin-antitoxin system